MRRRNEKNFFFPGATYNHLIDSLPYSGLFPGCQETPGHSGRRALKSPDQGVNPGGRKGQLEQSLAETSKALDEAKAENNNLKSELDSVKAKLSDLEKEKNDLITASKESEANSSQKVRALNNIINRLRAEIKEKRPPWRPGIPRLKP